MTQPSRKTLLALITRLYDEMDSQNPHIWDHMPEVQAQVEEIIGGNQDTDFEEPVADPGGPEVSERGYKSRKGRSSPKSELPGQTTVYDFQEPWPVTTVEGMNDDG